MYIIKVGHQVVYCPIAKAALDAGGRFCKQGARAEDGQERGGASLIRCPPKPSAMQPPCVSCYISLTVYVSMMCFSVCYVRTVVFGPMSPSTRNCHSPWAICHRSAFIVYMCCIDIIHACMFRWLSCCLALSLSLIPSRSGFLSRVDPHRSLALPISPSLAVSCLAIP